MKNVTKQMISWTKLKFPWLFYRVTKSYSLTRLALEMDRPRYAYCMVAKKPYFGLIMLAGQTAHLRKPFMQALVKREAQGAKSGFRMIEIGSWSGESSVVWANAIKQAIPDAASLRESMVLCVDPWMAYVADEQNRSSNAATLIMNDALRNQRVLKLFLHNVRTSGHSDIIKPFVGTSDEVLPALKKGYFDLVFVDGAHCYTNVVRDLANAAAVLRDGGVLCGDDLELQSDEVDLEFAEKHRERDMMIDPKTAHEFHPGVTLGVRDFFGVRIPPYHGFWAMRKNGSSWSPVVLN